MEKKRIRKKLVNFKTIHNIGREKTKQENKKKYVLKIVTIFTSIL